MSAVTADADQRGGLLDLIERLGNRLPDPATLFLLGAVFVVLLSALAAGAGWTVERRLPVQLTETVSENGSEVSRPKLDAQGRPVLTWQPTGETYRATSLLTRDGIYWLIRNLVKNFMAFPPLGVVLVGMFGIGVAERCGLIAAALKAFMTVVPSSLLTPAMVFLGIMSSLTLDAGYVVLPPLAAALYLAAGRSPLAGLAAVFAGVAAGFNANLLITGLDPLLAGFATIGGQVIDASYQMNPACNWWFMIASTVAMTLTGWAVTAWFVERRLAGKSAADGGPVVADAAALATQRLQPDEQYALRWAAAALLLVGLVVGLLITIPGAPLYSHWMPDPAGGARLVLAEMTAGELVPSASPFPRWVSAIVPLLFVAFLVPAIVYGAVVGKIRNDRDVAGMLAGAMSSMAPIIVLAFFAAQFIECFKYSGLDKMLAIAGGQALGRAELPSAALIVAFILLTGLFNLLIGSMSAKYAMLAPIFIPMFMMIGISPELTQAAYRIGDSVTNIITPLNPYMVIIVVFMQRIMPRGGTGTLIALMLPYTIVFTLVWTVLLLLWMLLGIPLGPDGPLAYP